MTDDERVLEQAEADAQWARMEADATKQALARLTADMRANRPREQERRDIESRLRSALQPACIRTKAGRDACRALWNDLLPYWDEADGEDA